MITSSTNRRVKQVIQLQKKARARKEADSFIVEGTKMAMEAPIEKIRQVFLSESYQEKYGIPKRLKDLDIEIVEDGVFARMSDTQTPQGILCEVRQYHYRLQDMVKKKAPLLLLLENLQDPGNVGTIFRTAEGAGVDGIILTEGTVDIYHPKTIRSTMGSIYRMPFFYTNQLEDVLALLKKADVTTYAAHLQGERTYDRENYQTGTAFFIGNEGNGLSEALSGKADRRIRIPMEGQLESLNAAVAAALLMYEGYRQRSLSEEQL